MGRRFIEELRKGRPPKRPVRGSVAASFAAPLAVPAAAPAAPSVAQAARASLASFAAAAGTDTSEALAVPWEQA